MFQGGNAHLEILNSTRGAEKDLADEEGVTPLMAACMAGSTACAEVLLDAGADRDASTSVRLDKASKKNASAEEQELLRRLGWRGQGLISLAEGSLPGDEGQVESPS